MPPSAPRIPHVAELHGDRRVDEYSWLRERDNPAVFEYLAAENAHTAAVMAPAKPLEDAIYAEMRSHIQGTDETVPVTRGEYLYSLRTIEDLQYPILCRRRGAGAPEEILLDGNELAKGHAYFQLGAFQPSPDQRFFAYSTDTAGDESFTICVKDLATGELLPDRISGAYYGLAWASDNRTFFYTVLDAAHRPYRLLRHTLGEAQDAVVYEETDRRFNLEIERSKSGRWLFLYSASQTTSEVLLLDAAQPGGRFTPLYPRQQEVEYSVAGQGDWFYVLTNLDAKNFRLLRAPAADPGNWTEILPPRPDVKLESVDAYRRHVVVSERDAGQLCILVLDTASGERHRIAVDAASTVQPVPLPEYDSPVLRYTVTSLITPLSVYDYDPVSRQRTLRKVQPVPGGFDASQYETERTWATAPDGTRVPVTVAGRKGLPRDGSTPLLLYGYGAYGIASDPEFNSDRLPLLDRGIRYAIAHVRGGGDLGELWHDAGKMLAKPNTFTDFIACAGQLIAAGYTAPAHLACVGRSAGGLLIGAVLNLRPNLFAAALAGVPFVDCLNTMLDPTLPLTVEEFEEWGNPAEKQYYDLLRSYAPYENVAARDYPALLVTAGITDPRVSYWEPAKWVARLRAVQNGARPLLLKTNLGAGHFGASGRYDHLRETAFEAAFLVAALKPESKWTRAAPSDRAGVSRIPKSTTS